MELVINQFLALSSDFYTYIIAYKPRDTWLINTCMVVYTASWSFHQVQFSLKISLQSFRSLIFMDASDNAHYTLYNCVYFADKFHG